MHTCACSMQRACVRHGHKYPQDGQKGSKKSSKFIDSVSYALKVGVTLHQSLARTDVTSVYVNIELQNKYLFQVSLDC